jgi:hypothetical protein
VIPVGDADSQMLVSIRKEQGQPQMSRLTGCRFVPLVGASEVDVNDSSHSNGENESPV